jgi:hypothetical protein
MWRVVSVRFVFFFFSRQFHEGLGHRRSRDNDRVSTKSERRRCNAVASSRAFHNPNRVQLDTPDLGEVTRTSVRWEPFDVELFNCLLHVVSFAVSSRPRILLHV